MNDNTKNPSNKIKRSEKNTIPQNDAMNRAIAKWLVDRTELTIQQIAQATGMHELAVKLFLNTNAGHHQSFDPLIAGFITVGELDACTKDPNKPLILKMGIPKDPVAMATNAKPRKTNFTSRIIKQARPAAVAWLIHRYPELQNKHIAKLTGATQKSIEKLRDPIFLRHVNPQNPMSVGICTQGDIDTMVIETKNMIHKDKYHNE